MSEQTTLVPLPPEEKKAKAKPRATGKDFRKIAPNRIHWYCGLDTDATLRLYHQQRAQAGVFERMWRTLHGPAQWALGHMERWGALLSEANVRSYDAFLVGEIAKYRAALVGAGGGDMVNFNPRSTPQMQKLLYEELKFKVIKKSKKTKAPATDYGTIQTLVTERWKIPFDRTGKPEGDQEAIAAQRRSDRRLDAVLAILDLRDALGQKSSYGIDYLKHVGYDGRVHTTYKVARTLRLTSSEPNLQNLRAPDDDEGLDDPGKRARGIYVPPPDHVIVSLDFSQVELRIAAMLSGDEKMADAFNQGRDFHTDTAMNVYGSAGKTERRLAKVINFSIPFGVKASSLATKMGVTEDKAQEYMRAYDVAYPDFAKWRKERVAEGYRDGQVTASWGDYTIRRRLPDLGETGDSRSADAIRGHAENVCVNTPIQGMANCYCLASMARVVAYLLDEGVPAELNLNVHDALVLYVRKDCWQEVARRCRDIMTAHDTGIVKLKVDVEMGEVDYGHLQKVSL